jgi:hypothetical protein
LAYRGHHSVICQGSLPQLADFGGFLYDPIRLSQHDMPTVTQTLRELPRLVNGLEAEP